MSYIFGWGFFLKYIKFLYKHAIYWYVYVDFIYCMILIFPLYCYKPNNSILTYFSLSFCNTIWYFYVYILSIKKEGSPVLCFIFSCSGTYLVSNKWMKIYAICIVTAVCIKHFPFSVYLWSLRLLLVCLLPIRRVCVYV